MAKAYHQLSPEEQKAKFDRLPAWAKEKLTFLRKTNIHLAEENIALRAHRYGPPGSPVVADPYADQPINLPSDTSIEFNLDPTGADSRKVVRVRILKDGKLDINANGTLWLNPRASNSVEITVGER